MPGASERLITEAREMLFAMVICEIHLPMAHSLKEKRRVVKGFVERLHRRLRVSIAETDFHDLHQRAQFGIAAVEATPGRLDALLQRLRETADVLDDAIVARWDVEIVEAEA